MIDGSGGRFDGLFFLERSGGLFVYFFIELCYFGKYIYDEMVVKVSLIGGMYDYLGIKDMIEIENRIKEGDEKVKFIMDVFIY